MSRSVAVETEENDNSTETNVLLEDMETSPSLSVTSEEVVRYIKKVIYPLIQQLDHLCELMQELRNEQAHRRYEQTASSRAASTSTGNAGRCGIPKARLFSNLHNRF